MTSFALLIGCNYPKTSAELGGCVNDTQDMKRFLVEEARVPPRNIIEMCDDGSTYYRPTADYMLAGIRWLVQQAWATPDARLFLHFSGHGTRIKDTNNDEADGFDECICPTDFEQKGVIVDDVLRRSLVDALPSWASLFFLCDSCHSAGILDSYYELSHENRYTAVTTNPNVRRPVADVRVLTGCASIECAGDIYLPETRKKAGAMTTAFLGAFLDWKRSGEERTPTIQEFMLQMQDRLVARGMTQRPTVNSSRPINPASEFSNLFKWVSGGATQASAAQTNAQTNAGSRSIPQILEWV